MKNILNFIMIFILGILLSGCTKNSYTFDVNEKTIKVEEIKAVDASLIGDKKDILSGIIDEKLNSYNVDGVFAERYDDGAYFGVKITKEGEIKNFGNNELPKGFTTPQDSAVDAIKGMFGTIYRVHLFFNPNVAIQGDKSDFSSYISQNNNFENDVQMQSSNISKTYKTPQNEFIDSDLEKNQNGTLNTPNASDVNLPNLSDKLAKYEVTIKIPKKASMHNASKVISDKEYFWELSPTERSEIVIEFTRIDFNTFGSILIVLFIILVSAHYIRKFKKSAEM